MSGYSSNTGKKECEACRLLKQQQLKSGISGSSECETCRRRNEKSTSDTKKNNRDFGNIVISRSGSTRYSQEDVEEEDGILKKAGMFALKTAGISGAVLAGVAIGLPLIGFGPLGPIAGSLAAAYQSSVLGGTIVSGSAFATLQSVGMVGLSAAAKSTVVATSAVISAATSGGKQKKK